MRLNTSLFAHLLHHTAEHGLTDWGITKPHNVFKRIKWLWDAARESLILGVSALDSSLQFEQGSERKL